MRFLEDEQWCAEQKIKNKTEFAKMNKEMMNQIHCQMTNKPEYNKKWQWYIFYKRFCPYPVEFQIIFSKHSKAKRLFQTLNVGKKVRKNIGGNGKQSGEENIQAKNSDWDSWI